MKYSFTATEQDRRRRLDVFLADKLPELSRSRVQHLIEAAKVTLQDVASLSTSKSRAPSPGLRLRGGETISIELEPPAPLRAYAEALPLEILYEDDAIVAINKPAGMVVHIGAGVKTGTLVNALLHHFRNLSGVGGETRPGIVHRLDRNTSGVLLVAKNDQAHRKLAEQFASRTLEKHYIALVHGSMPKPEGVIRAPIQRDPARRIRMTARRTGGRAAESRYRVLRRYQGFSLLGVQILTGRTHQVRVHLSSINHPVVGDTLYGAPGVVPPELLSHGADGNAALPARDSTAPSRSRRSDDRVPTLPRTFLHAERIRFTHPSTGASLEIRAPLPPDLDQFLTRLVPLT